MTTITRCRYFIRRRIDYGPVLGSYEHVYDIQEICVLDPVRTSSDHPARCADCPLRIKEVDLPQR